MKVRIYKPAKSATQSGRARVGQWILEYELKSPRRPEPVMGWSSSEDTLNQVRLKFDDLESAISFAEKRGWDHAISAPNDRKVKPRSNLDNYRYEPFADV